MGASSKKFWWGAALMITLVGLGASIYLTHQHFSILGAGFTGKTLCNINQYLNCDMVLLSRFSEIGTIPLSGMGLVFYVYLLGALVYSRVDLESADKILTLPYLLIIFSFILSLFLAYVSMYQIKALCIFCSTLYLVNLLLLITVMKVMNMNVKGWVSNLRKIAWGKSLVYFLIVFGAGIIILHTGHKQFAKDISDDQLNLYLDAILKLPEKSIDTKGRPFWGNPDAKITVVEFSDFECPYCKIAAFTLKPILGDFRDRMKLVFMNFPLDQSCNPAIAAPLHRQSCTTAFAAYCAEKQGKFWEYHDLAFERQPKFNQKALENMAKKLKLDLTKFNDCLTNPRTKEFIEADIQQGIQMGLHGTPAIFVNGRPFQPWQSKKAWKVLMDRLEPS